MSATRNPYALFLVIFGFVIALSSAQDNFVCYADSKCGVEVERPIFYLGSSVSDCCGTPNVLSVASDNCSQCLSEANRITPRHVALYPPDDLVLEVMATGFDTITWLINGTVMHDFDRMTLENDNKRLILANTTDEDYGIYSADIHLLDTQVVQIIDFYVYEYVQPKVELSQPPNEDGIANGLVEITCSAYANPVPNDINVYCDSNLTISSVGEALITNADTFGELPMINKTAYVLASEANGIEQCYCETSTNDDDTVTFSTAILPVSASVISFLATPNEVIAPMKIQLSCEAKGRPLPMVGFYKNGQSLSLMNQNVIIDGYKVTLTLNITNTTIEDYGSYYCNVVNIYAEENSTAILVNVESFPIISTTTPSIVANINVQKEATFNCKARGNPESQILWVGEGGELNSVCTSNDVNNLLGEAAIEYDYYEGDYVPKNCEIRIIHDNVTEGPTTTESLLIIKELDMEAINSTGFRCFAKNDVPNINGAKEYVTVHLQLEDGPYFLTTPLPSYNLQFKSAFAVDCDVIGKSSTDITWLKDGEIIPLNDDHFLLSINSGSTINSTLTISSILHMDEGTYTCRATNDEGTIEHNFQISVFGVLEIHSTPQTLDRLIGETLILSCKVTSESIPMITWFNDQNTIVSDNNSNISITDTVTHSNNTLSVVSVLTVEDLDASDNGMYVCQAAINSMMEEQNIATVNVYAPVTVSITPSIVRYDNSSSVTVNCTGTGLPNPTLTFLGIICFDTEPEGEAEEVYLAMESGNFSVYCVYPEEHDSVKAVAITSGVDRYGTMELLCIVENSISSANATSLFITQAAPGSIETTGSDQDVLINGSFTLSCEGTGYPTPTVSWIKDGNTIVTPSDTVSIVTSDPVTLSNGLHLINSSLTVIQLGLDNEGAYSCQFSNDAGEEVATVASVDVKAAPGSIETTGSDQDVLINGSFTLSCEGTGDPTPTVSWIKDGNTIVTPSDTVSILISDPVTLPNGLHLINSSLTVIQLGLDNEGVYSCQFSNDAGEEVATVASVDVKVPVTLKEFAQSHYVHILGETTTINCTGSGDPPPSVTFHGLTCTGNTTQEQIESSDGYFIGSCYTEPSEGGVVTNTLSLTVKPDFRDYADRLELICIVDNDLLDSEGVNKSVTIDLTGPPEISDISPLIQLEYGGTQSLVCTVTGFPISTVYWSLSDTTNSQPFINTHVDEFTVTSALNMTTFYPNNAGLYLCVANSTYYGIYTQAVLVTVNGVVPVVSTSYTELTKEVGSKISFFCNATGYPLPSITWIKTTAGSDDQITSGSGIDEDEESSLNDDGNVAISTVSDPIVDDSIISSYSTLTVSSIELSDEGTYSCLATNQAGTTSSQAGQLTVEESPSVSLSDSSVIHTVPVEGATTAVTCIGTGKPAPSVTFGGSSCTEEGNQYFDNGTMIVCNSFTEELLHYVSLTITFTQAISIFGDITLPCIVDNGVTPIATNTTIVNIKVLDTVIVNPSSITINETDSFTLLCTATGHPLPSLVWLASGTTVLVSEKRSITTKQVNSYTITSILTVTDTIPDDMGEYKCRAEGSGGFHILDSSHVSINAIDECSLVDNPCNGNGVCFDGLKDYKCVCSDDFTGVNCDIANNNNTMKTKPELVENPQNKTSVPIHDPFNVTCEATGDPQPTYLWLVDDELRYNDTGPVLTITEADPSDRGYYQCVAVNSLGNQTSEPGLVFIEGIYQYVIEFEKDSQFNQTVLTKMVDCLTAESLLSPFNQTIIYSLESCSKPGCESGNGGETILMTLYQTETPYSFVGLTNAIEKKLSNLATDCSLGNIRVHDTWRFDGCRETNELFHPEYELHILWSESDIEENFVRSCPCGNLTASVYTNGTASRECGGTYSNGGVWLQSDTSQCEYNQRNENITLTLCHLTNEAPASYLSSALRAITMDSAIFQPLDLTIASLILERLVQSDEIIEDEEIQMDFVQSISNMMQTTNEVARESQTRHKSTTRVLNSLDTFQRLIEVSSNNTMMQFVTDNLGVAVFDTEASHLLTNITLYVRIDEDQSLNGLDILNSNMSISDASSSLFLPGNILESSGLDGTNDETIRVAYSVFSRDALFQSHPQTEYAAELAAGNLTVGIPIVSATLVNNQNEVVIHDLDIPVVIEFRKPESVHLNKTNATCVYWNDTGDDSQHGWSPKGCYKAEDSDIVRCECDHLTHFGYLLDVVPSDDQPDDLLALEILIYILCIISIICLLIVIITYTLSKSLRYRTQGKIVINFSIALVGVYTMYMVAVNAEAIRGIDGIRGDVLCGVIGALLYYFLLVYFMWTGFQAIDLYRKLVKVFNTQSRYFVLYGALVCWGIPLGIAVIAAIAGRNDYIEYEYFCRPSGPTFYVGFLLPFAVVYAFNWAAFLIIIIKLWSRRTKKKEYESDAGGLSYKKILMVAIILSVTFGLGWIFGLLVTNQYPEELYITFIVLFSLFVGLQGVLVFVLHCVRNQLARRTWKMWFYVVCCCQSTRNAKILSKLITSGTTATPAMTPAVRRKFPAFSSTPAPESTSTQMQPLSSLAKKYSTSMISEREDDSIGDPLNDFETAETFIGTALGSPLNFDDVDIGMDMSNTQSRTSKTGLETAKKDLAREDEEMFGSNSEGEDDNNSTSKKRMSKKMSKKELKKEKKSKKKTRMVEVREDNQLGGSEYSLLSSVDMESQVIQIDYKGDLDTTDDDDGGEDTGNDVLDGREGEDNDGGELREIKVEVEKRKTMEDEDDEWLKQQYRDIHDILDRSFVDSQRDDGFSGEVLY